MNLLWSREEPWECSTVHKGLVPQAFSMNYWASTPTNLGPLAVPTLASSFHSNHFIYTSVSRKLGFFKLFSYRAYRLSPCRNKIPILIINYIHTKFIHTCYIRFVFTSMWYDQKNRVEFAVKSPFLDNLKPFVA